MSTHAYIQSFFSISIFSHMQVGGTVMYAENFDVSVQVTLYPGLITVYQANGSTFTSASFSSNSTLDGDWHTLSISLHPTGLQVTALIFLYRTSGFCFEDAAVLLYSVFLSPTCGRIPWLYSSLAKALILHSDNNAIWQHQPYGRIVQKIFIVWHFPGCAIY